MLMNPVLKPMETPRPAKISGVARTSTSEKPYNEPNTPLKKLMNDFGTSLPTDSMSTTAKDRMITIIKMYESAAFNRSTTLPALNWNHSLLIRRPSGVQGSSHPHFHHFQAPPLSCRETTRLSGHSTRISHPGLKK